MSFIQVNGIYEIASEIIINQDQKIIQTGNDFYDMSLVVKFIILFNFWWLFRFNQSLSAQLFIFTLITMVMGLVKLK